MEKFFSFWEFTFIPNITRFYNNKYFSAVRRSFYVLLPFWLTISFFDLIGNVFFNPTGFLMDKDGLNLGFWITGMSGEDYLQSDFVQRLQICKKIISGGYSIVAMTIVITLSSQLSEIWKSDKTLTMLSSMAAFVLAMTLYGVQNEASSYFSELGFFSAFSITFVSARIFSWLYNFKKLQLKPPKSLPKEMAKYLSNILPVSLTLIIFAASTTALYFLKIVGEFLWLGLAELSIFQNPAFVLLYQFVVWFLWWLGIPGYGVTARLQELAYIPAQLDNQIGETTAIFTEGFFEAGVIHVLGLIIAILVFSQHESWRKVSKFSLPLMAFNVQEVFIFGLPVILNPIFLIPYLLAPLANTLVGYFAISWGIVPVFQVDVPWTMPLFFGAIIGTHSFMGGILQIIWLIMDIFIYAPFVITANAMIEGRGKE